MSSDPSKPWVLVRKGFPPMRFETLERAKGIYDSIRYGRSGAPSDGVIFGPEGKEYRCGRYRGEVWVEVIGERRSAKSLREEALGDEEVEAS